MASTRDMFERFRNLDNVKDVPQHQLPDIREATDLSLTVKDFGATLYPNSWTDLHFDIGNPGHVERWELYRNTMEIWEVHGANADHLGDANFHGLDFVDPDAETTFWSEIVRLHPRSKELRSALDMLPALQSDSSRTPRGTFIASLVMHPAGWYLFHRLLTIPGLIAHFCYRWGVRMGVMCTECSHTYRTHVNGNLEHTLAPHTECVVFRPPMNGKQLGRGACTNCIRTNPTHECEWATFPQAQKRHEREGPDEITFAGENWASENENADYYTLPRLNSRDCIAIGRIAMPPILFDDQGRALRIDYGDQNEII
ncbi:hypothetical protein FPOAC1_003873 [Fusarium poae]|uniref:hypothetical protein n=1 Tax=Fusarium poae TaxID=36050 RepID=UPI001CE7FA48|nr:hypothetical protein FPOAC1_003873 [Fusarium poae]KAG8677845.1 hypothetical protein FPOAC1_003873 [Fusarium poae]